MCVCVCVCVGGGGGGGGGGGDIKCRYILFMFPQKNLARNGLIKTHIDNKDVVWTVVWPMQYIHGCLWDILFWLQHDLVLH